MLFSFSHATREAGPPIALAVLGFALVVLIDNQTLAAELAIFITFGLNIVVLLSPSLKRFRILARRISAAFALGAVGALLIAG